AGAMTIENGTAIVFAYVLVSMGVITASCWPRSWSGGLLDGCAGAAADSGGGGKLPGGAPGGLGRSEYIEGLSRSRSDPHSTAASSPPMPHARLRSKARAWGFFAPGVLDQQ